jgi:hypothetical protein
MASPLRPVTAEGRTLLNRSLHMLANLLTSGCCQSLPRDFEWTVHVNYSPASLHGQQYAVTFSNPGHQLVKIPQRSHWFPVDFNYDISSLQTSSCQRTAKVNPSHLDTGVGLHDV